MNTSAPDMSMDNIRGPSIRTLYINIIVHNIIQRIVRVIIW